jgi:hypothetical protein
MDIMFIYYINLYNVISIYRSKKIQSKKKKKREEKDKKEWSKQNQLALNSEIFNSKLSEMRTLKSLLKQLMIIQRVAARLQVGISIYQGRQAKYFSPFFKVWESNMIAIKAKYNVQLAQNTSYVKCSFIAYKILHRRMKSFSDKLIVDLAAHATA